MPPEMRRHIYDLGRIKVFIEPGPVYSIEGDIDADVIRHSREAEEYTQKHEQWERRFSTNPQGFEAAYARAKKDLQKAQREDTNSLIIPVSKPVKEVRQWVRPEGITC